MRAYRSRTETQQKHGRATGALRMEVKREVRAKTYEKRIIADMRSVGTYREEYLESIKTLAKMYEDLDKAKEQFSKFGDNFVIRHTNKNGSTNLVKNPLYLAIEGMQRRILEYNRELGLTPAGLKKIKGGDSDDGSSSGLMEALKSLGS
jgi:phage terminase small subunit